MAGVVVFVALVAPNGTGNLGPAAFARIPVEALVGVAVLVVLPARPRRVTAALAGVALGGLAVLRLVDWGFHAVLARPFDPVFDWGMFGRAGEFLTASLGGGGALGITAAAGLLAVAVLVCVPLSVLRLTRVAVTRRSTTLRLTGAAGVVWLVCAVLSVELTPGVPVASGSAADLAYDHARQFGASLRDGERFAQEAAVDDFRATPGAQLLTGLRGKDVVVAFVESYGRDAVEDPQFAPDIGAVLAAGGARLRAAGFGSRSAYLTSPTLGGGSWLAHATLLSGLWVDNEQRYRTLLNSDRFTLNRAFRRAGWRTVGVMPGLTRAWPEGRFYGYDRVYGADDLGYRGPRFSWATMPDQFTLAAFERLERARADRAPVMAEIPLLSSHAPWSPLPRLVGWEELGDGSVFASMAGPGAHPDAISSRETSRVRDDYRKALEYSLTTLVSYVEAHGDDDLVLVVLGDHQPSPLVTGEPGSRDVPVSVIARDPRVFERLGGWGWHDGLEPGPDAPVWRMDAFRDRFLTAFGPRGAGGS
ncbi:sulfatase [Prauserella muralis]|uniref:Sulfatase n=1 Tax=Prauserella muralis TaxID=588067 RepID=A0A2V4AQA0_9PSEU|nr:sulfatase [Prauserella muralis]